MISALARTVLGMRSKESYDIQTPVCICLMGRYFR